MKKVPLKNILSIVLSISLIACSFFCGDRIAEEVKNTALKLGKIKKDTISISVNKNSVSAESPEYTMVGFGGGGYGGSEASPVPKDIEALKLEAKEIFKNYKKSGDIDEVQMGKTSNTLSYGDICVNNRTGVNINIKEYLSKKPSYKKITKDKPYILIYHTHTTEGYEMLDLGWYSNSYNSRTKDGAKTVVRVGDEIQKELEKQGFKVIHDKTIYDASYNGAYSRSRKGIEKILSENPSIMITLDIHRDAIHYKSGTKCKPTAKINGKKAAQVMIISGCEGDGVEGFKTWKENLCFALNLQSAVEEKNKGLMRPVFFCHRKYNMDKTPCSLLLEFGTDANTLEEAVFSGSLVGKALGEMLNKEIKK